MHKILKCSLGIFVKIALLEYTLYTEIGQYIFIINQSY